jgi:hypothetical protein
MSCRVLLFPVLVLTTALCVTVSAGATVARALSLTQLARLSDAAAVGTPVSRSSAWEQIAGHKRLVTYTRFKVSRRVFGLAGSDDDLVVRTLGGRIGDLGQVVHGEAHLPKGKLALLFLRRLQGAHYRVTGMAQGHIPVGVDNGVLRVIPGSSRAHLLGGPMAALTAVGRDLDSVIRTILEARSDD